ncbi:MAG TPA: class I SAM-dependent methyltransferase, partial [Ktedonobacteraceae bacterium]|nr:class I SAM-dependent methyltransferase [Ktedonobacteraceae bacterium]
EYNSEDNRVESMRSNREEPMSEIKNTTMPQQEQIQVRQNAEHWGHLVGLRQILYDAATRQMLETAHLKQGDRVLDIAAGVGDQSRLAAHMVGPEGSILATDISQDMLDVAAQLAHQDGLNNITTRAMNAEQLDLPNESYDAAISRFGLMLIPHKQQALAEVYRVLKPGGKIAALVWSQPERNPLMTLYIDLVIRLLAPLEEGDPSFNLVYSLADAELFAHTLADVGFQDVRVQAIDLTFHFPSFESLTTWWGPDYDRALASLQPEARQGVVEEVQQTVRHFEGPQGIQAPAELLLGFGTK